MVPFRRTVVCVAPEGELEPQCTHRAVYVIEPKVRDGNMTDGIVEVDELFLGVSREKKRTNE
jgi:hypothetical protein